MQIETERLIIRPFRAEDEPALYEYLSDAEVVRYEPYHPMSMEEVRAEAVRRAEDKAFGRSAKRMERLLEICISTKVTLIPGSWGMCLTAGTGNRDMRMRVRGHCLTWPSGNGMSGG